MGWYELGPSLGHGMCGPVKRAVHRLTGEEVAIKTLSRDRSDPFLFVIVVSEEEMFVQSDTRS